MKFFLDWKWQILITILYLSLPAFGDDWPQWRGPNHNDISQEKSGWPNGWPPKKLWSTNVGFGCTSPIIAHGQLYVMGWSGNRQGRNPIGNDIVYCFQIKTGKLLWRQSYQCLYQGRFRKGDTAQYGGPSSTPSFDTETSYLYTLSIDGDLCCWDTGQQGSPAWSINLYDKYNIPRRPQTTPRGTRDYGYTSSPLIQGNLLIIEVGDDEGTLMAFDKRDGRRKWTSSCNEPAGHNGGPVPLSVQSIPCVADLALRKLVIVRIDKGNEGQTVAEYNWTTDFANNIATPAVANNKIILTSGYNQHRTSLIDISLNGAKQLWNSREFSGVSSPVIYKNNIYIADGSLKCLNFQSGRLNWRGGRFKHGSCIVTAGDDKIIVFGSRTLALVEAVPSSSKYQELCRVEEVCSDTCYPHVAFSDGIICCKDKAGNLICFSVQPP